MAKLKKKDQSKNKNLYWGISTGTSIGIFLGWSLFDQIGLGALVGSATGAIIGSLVDDQKK